MTSERKAAVASTMKHDLAVLVRVTYTRFFGARAKPFEAVFHPFRAVIDIIGDVQNP